MGEIFRFLLQQAPRIGLLVFMVLFFGCGLADRVFAESEACKDINANAAGELGGVSNSVHDLNVLKFDKGDRVTVNLTNIKGSGDFDFFS